MSLVEKEHNDIVESNLFSENLSVSFFTRNNFVSKVSLSITYTKVLPINATFPFGGSEYGMAV